MDNQNNKICPNCGAEIASNAVFCTNCGARMPETPVNLSDEPVNEQSALQADIPAGEKENAESTAEKTYYGNSDTYGYAYANTAEANANNSQAAVKNDKKAPIGAFGFFGILLLCAIPIVGPILVIVWACGGCRKEQKSNFARGVLLKFAFDVIVVLILLGIFFAKFAAFIKSINSNGNFEDFFDRYLSKIESAEDLEKIYEGLKELDKNNKGSLSLNEINDMIEDLTD